MIKFITISPSSPFNFILNKEVGGGVHSLSLQLKLELKKLTFLGWNFGRTLSSPKGSQFKIKLKLKLKKMKLIGVGTMLVKLLDMFLNFNLYRNPSKLNKFEFGG